MSEEFNTKYEAWGKALETDMNMQPYQTRSNITVRPEFQRSDYESSRPAEYIPKGDTQEDLRKIMRLCISAYERVGLIRSVIDMMSEFASEGIEIVHPDEGPNEFYKVWSKKVNLEDRVERLSNWCLKAGNVVIRRQFGQVQGAKVKDGNVSDNKNTNQPGYIPLKYSFYNPADVERIGGKAASFSTNQRYALRIPTKYLSDTVKYDNIDQSVIEGMPIEIRNVFTNENPKYNTWLIPLDPSRIYVGFYKKDDDQIWAKSFIYSILEDVFYNDKVRQAKTSTLDNMISIVRLWKLGDHTHELLPSPSLGAKLANILSNHTGGGPMDIIWDSAINLEEFYPPIDKLVGFEENYHSILLGLGVPESLVGGTTEKSNLTSSTLGFKNLIKRLEACRRIISEWLESEIDIIQKNMGFRKRPYIRFANEDLYDERTYYNLLLQLVDRNILSDERILQIINEIPEIEQLRVQKENQKKNGKDSPEKASPYHNPQLKMQQQHEMKKFKSQQEDNSNNLSKKDLSEKKNGRPPDSKDTVRRKRGPNRASTLIVFANKLYDYADNLAKRIAYNHLEINDVRKFNNEQKDFLDQLKLQLIASCPPNAELSDEVLLDNFNKSMGTFKLLNQEIQEYLRDIDSTQSKLTVEEYKLFVINSYVTIYENMGINTYENI